MQLQAGELGVVWGLRGSGRTTLLRIAAGVEPPDRGVVRFDGLDLARDGERLLGGSIGWCQPFSSFTDGQTTLEHTMVALLSRWVRPAIARRRAGAALERVGAGECGSMRASEPSSAESVRVALARALTVEPRLLVIAEPVRGVELRERDSLLALLRALADEGIAVLASAGEPTVLSEADAGFTLGSGRLTGVHAPLADVIGLPTPPRGATISH